jgi:hypothetical protein
MVFEPPPVSLSVGIHVSIASVWTFGQTLFLFGIEQFMRHTSAPGKYEDSNFKLAALPRPPPPSNRKLRLPRILFEQF